MRWKELSDTRFITEQKFPDLPRNQNVLVPHLL